MQRASGSHDDPPATRKNAFFTLAESGARLRAPAKPGAAKDGIAGIWTAARGEVRLSVNIAASADKGAANAAILKILAKRLGLPKSSLSITAGKTSRLKSIDIEGDADAIADLLRKLAGENG